MQRYKTTYCAGDDFLKLVDGLESSDKARRARIVERRINYVLKSGANWAGPIKDFHLVVDKGQPDRIVSFCGQGISKSPRPSSNCGRRILRRRRIFTS